MSAYRNVVSLAVPYDVDDELRLEGIVHAAGMGTVYAATNRRTGGRHAVKIFGTEWSARSPTRRFASDMKRLAAVKHPSLPPVARYGVLPDGRYYIVSAWRRGVSLASQLSSSPTPSVSGALKMLRQVARALDALHDAGIVHATLSPDKILLDGDPRRVFVTGAGARAMLAGHPSEGNHTGIATSPNGIDYVAPESDRISCIDARSDIYALTILAFRVLTGRFPFPRREYVVPAIVDRQQRSPSTLEEAIGRCVPVHAERAFRRGLARDPATRYKRASQFIIDLTVALGAVTSFGDDDDLDARRTLRWEKASRDGERYPSVPIPVVRVVRRTEVPRPNAGRVTPTRARRRPVLLGAIGVLALGVLLGLLMLLLRLR